MGSATLWRLTERGVRAVGVDRFTPPHDRGSTHGGSRIIRTAYFEDPAYLPMVRTALELWRGLQAETSESLLTMTGAAMIGPPESDIVAGSLRTAQVHGLHHELLDGDEAARRFPQHRLDAGDVVLREHDGGVLDPERCVAAMLRRARARGAHLQTDCAVRSVEPRRHGVRLHLDDGTAIAARAAVVCAGPWTSSLLPDLPWRLRIERQVNAWFPVHDPAQFHPDRFPVFIRRIGGGRLVYGVPSLDSATVKLAVHHEGAPVDDPDTVPREITPEDIASLADYAETSMRGVDPHPVRAITCLYTNTPDEHFVIDALPDMPNVVVVSACSGHGFKFAPAIGEVAADLAAPPR